MSNNKKYIALYYASFLVTICAFVFLTNSITVFSLEPFPYGFYVLALAINLAFVVLFSIFLFMKKILFKVNLLFPVLYLLFFGFVLFFSIIYEDRLLLPVVHYQYYYMFVLGDYLLLNIYSILSFKSRFLNEKYTEEGMNEESIKFLFDLRNSKTLC